MMNIRILTIGNLKEPYLRAACDEYIKRLACFCKITVEEISESKIGDNPSQKEIQNALESESKPLLKAAHGKIIALCIEGKQITSPQLAQMLEDFAVDGNSSVTFIIGSSYGLSDTVKNCADLKLSVSKMTFPHQLMRVMLIEQIYRCFQILSGGKYHK